MTGFLTHRFFLLFSLFCLLLSGSTAAADRYAEDRRTMIRAIEANARDASYYINRKELDGRVISAMGRVERHRFVPENQVSSAYENRPLPIGHGQTISQPYIVALMSDLVNIEPGDKVIEVGTGSGYQAAVLAEMGADVFSVEIVKPLAEQAARRLAELGYSTITTREDDGYYGWEKEAPFDAIVVTAAASHVPPPLLRQLKKGGTMIIPVGGRFMVQQLVLVTKDEAGGISARQILPVRFVPLTGGH